MMKKILLLFALGLLFIQCHSTKKKAEQTMADQTAAATGKPAGKPDKDYIPIDPDVRIGKLANGMTYYIRRNAKPEKKVYMLLPVKVGSVVEDDDQQGLAHFMEHMNFNGTKNFPKNKLVEFLQNMGVRFGADLNAFTSFDKTVYILPIPIDNPENLDKGLLVLHDWAYFATLDPQEIDKERGVVLEEYRLGQGAEERMRRKWWPVLLQGSRYAERLPIGKKEILETFPHDVLKRFHKDWYRPDLEAVIVVGDIDPGAVEQKLQKMFADIPAPQNPRERKFYTVPNHKETRVAVASDPEAMFNRVLVTYKAREDYKPMKTVDDYRQKLLTDLYLKMLNNRLDDIKEQANTPYSGARAYYGTFIAQTKEAFVLSAATPADKRLAALDTLLYQAKKAKLYGFTPGEFERAKKELMANIEQAYQNRNTTDSDNFAWQYQAHFTQGEPIPSVEWEYNMHKWFLPRIQLSEVNALGKKFIHDDNRVIVVAGLKKEGIPDVSENDVWNTIRKVDAQNIPAPKESTEQLSLMTDKPAPGSIVSETRNDKLGTVTLKLSNGATVTYKKTDFKNDEVLVQYWKFGGKSLLTDDEVKKTAFAFKAVPEAGVNGLNKKELRKVLAGKKIKVTPAVDDIDSYGNGSFRPADMETWFQLNFLYYTKPNYDPEAFASWKKRQAFMVNLTNNPMYKFLLEYYKFVNQNNPRYVPIFPTKEWIDNQDYKLAYDKFREFFDGASGYHFYFVGNFDEQKLRQYIQTYIGGLPASQRPDKYRPLPDYTLTGKHEFIFHKGTEPQSMVIIGQYSPAKFNYTDNLYLKAFGEILTNRLIKEIRENESGVYSIGAHAGMRDIPDSKVYLGITFPCGPENAIRLKNNALKVYRDLLQNGPTDEDLNKIKQSWLSQYRKKAKENNFWLSYLADTDYYGYDAGRFFAFENFVNNMTTDDLRRVAQKYLSRPKSDITGIWLPENYDDQGHPLKKEGE